MSSKQKVEILNVGNELLLGIRMNTHLSYLSKQLSALGLSVKHCQIVSDEEGAIKAALAVALKRSDVIITTGGLGPTVDDLTRESVACALGRELIYCDSIYQAISDRFLKLGRKVSSIHKKQCYQIAGSTIIQNDRGTAPGIAVEVEGKQIILLPGPTHELVPMFEGKIIPLLSEKGYKNQTSASIQLRFCGIGESVVEEKMKPIAEKYPTLEFAFCVHLGLVDVRLSSTSKKIDSKKLFEIGAFCEQAFKEDFVGFGEVSLPEVIFQKLRKSNRTLAVAESCTGGLMGNAFTDIPGVSKVFKGGVICYANEVKVLQLGVPEEIIEQHGAVSSECAIAMASGAAENLSADFGLSITGFAGPEGGNSNNPVGTIHIGLHTPLGVWAKSVRYLGGRLDVKSRAVNAALDWMRRELLIQEGRL